MMASNRTCLHNLFISFYLGIVKKDFWADERCPFAPVWGRDYREGGDLKVASEVAGGLWTCRLSTEITARVSGGEGIAKRSGNSATTTCETKTGEPTVKPSNHRTCTLGC